MTKFENLATADLVNEYDDRVKEELQIAGIPVLTLPSYMCSEVKTHYIGILNGFVFHRRWRYWQCDGLLPLEYAVELYAKYKDLSIRAGGDASNPHPSKMSINPVYMEKLRQHLNNVGIEEYDKTKSSIIDDKSLPRFVNFYHIDTQLGLQKLAECIRSNNIHTELID